MNFSNFWITVSSKFVLQNCKFDRELQICRKNLLHQIHWHFSCYVGSYCDLHRIFFWQISWKCCFCCRKIYTIHFPPLHSNVLHVFSHCSYIFPTWAFLFSWNKIFVWQLFLCCSIFLHFHLIPTTWLHSFFGNKDLEGIDFLEIHLEALVYNNLLRISNDQDFLWTIGNTCDAILLILSQVHWLYQGSSHKVLLLDKLNLHLLWVSFLWHSDGFIKL